MLTAQVLQVGLIWKSSENPKEWYTNHWNILVQSKTSEKNSEN